MMIPPEEMPFDAPNRATKPVKVKIEFADESGTKYSFNIEGTSKENISKLLDFAQAVSVKQAQDQPQEPMDTNFARVYTLIQDRFRLGSFNSGDVLEAYREEFKVPTSLSVIATYLSRLTSRNLLTRSKHGPGWIYKLPKLQQPQDVPGGIPP
ncbi:MAG TPA: hypothetical protein VED17_01340 [Nitrososphaerales archaeon]|nr:hypothetical protein [Nitrososphaerales archaeon]